jgi:hypothetical protein
MIEIRIDKKIRVIFTEMLTDVDYDLFWKGIDPDSHDGSDGSYSETVERIHGVCSSIAESFDFQIWYEGQNSFAEFTDADPVVIASAFMKEFPDLKIEFTGGVVDALLKEWIVVEFPDDENAIRITHRSNFEKMDYCKAYGNYGVQVDCYHAGCYSFSNSSSEIFERFYDALHTDGGFGVGSLMDDNELTYKELVEMLQDPSNHANGEKIFGSQFPKMVEFFKIWRDANENHTEVTGWTYHDSHNFRTVVSEADFNETDCTELDEDEQIAILLQYPGIPHIEGTNESEETENYIFHFDRWATNPWTCYVDKK